MDKLKYIRLENPDGSYTESIPLAIDSDYVDVNGNTLTNKLNDKANVNDISRLQNQINGLASGSPLVASSISGMTNTSKVYVNTTDGNWYYYNGSSWMIGGVYQSVELDLDTTLLANTKAPNSLTVGNKIRRIETMMSNNFQVEDFALGDINNQHRYSPNKTYRIATTSIIHFTQDVYIKIPAYWKVYQHTYDASGNYIAGLGWFTGIVKLQKTNYYMFVIARTTEDTSETLNVTEVLDMFKIVPVNQIELNLNYGGTIRITPSMNGKIDIKQSGNNLIVIVPNKLFIWKQKSGSDTFTPIDLTTLSYTLTNNDLLVLNLSTNLLEVINQVTFNANQEKYIILLWNHYGNPKGQWDKYFYFNKIDFITNVSKEENTVEFTCRQGQVNDYPENTLIAFKRAKEYGYNHIRVAIVFSSDGIPVCSHSDQVSGSTLRDNNGDVITDTSIYLSGLLYNEIITDFDAGIYKGSQFSGVRVPSFESVLIQAKRLNQKVDIEYKGGYSNANIDNLLMMIYKYGMNDKCLYTTTDISQLNYIKTHDYPIKIGLIAHLQVNTVNAAINNGCDRIDIFDTDSFNEQAVLLARKNNLKIKMGSAYSLAQVKNFINYYDVIECANILNPVYALIEET